MKRRDVVARGLAGSALLLTPSQLFAELFRTPSPPAQANRPWFAAALKAGDKVLMLAPIETLTKLGTLTASRSKAG